MNELHSRRDFLRQMSAATLAALAAGEPRLFGDEKLVHPKPTADACILLWMAGGMAAPETFDPKRFVPFEVGIPADSIMSTFPAIDTVVDDIKISQGLEHVAKIMDRGTLIRSHVQPATSCTRGISTTGTPATFRRKQSRRRISERGWRRCSGPAIRQSRR
jgi:hypothetical protein